MTLDTIWDNFPVDEIRARTFWKRALIHAELVRAVRRRARGGVLEVGVGSGAQSALLSRYVSTVTVDNDLRIIAAAGPNLRRFGRGVRVVAGDAFALPFSAGAFGVSVSQGLMEHFEDEEIGALVREQLRVCRSVVFSVPSDHYPAPLVGNERFLPPARWQRVVEAAVDPERFAVRARYYRFDPEALVYSARALRRLGPFSILVTVDPRGDGRTRS